MRILLCALLLMAGTAAAQPSELLGRYGASFIGGETIDFVKTDSFYFGGFYCTYGVQGKGTCEIRDGCLYLYFSKQKQFQKPVQRPPETAFESAAATTVQIKVVDQETGQPVPYASIAGYIKKRMLFGVNADNSGRAVLSIAPGRLPAMLSCTSVGYQAMSLTIDSTGSYQVTFYMMPGNSGNRVLNNGEIWAYGLGEITDTYFEARPAWGRGPFRIYQKK